MSIQILKSMLLLHGMECQATNDVYVFLFANSLPVALRNKGAVSVSICCPAPVVAYNYKEAYPLSKSMHGIDTS
jgi:hypothetical protein